MSRRYITDTLYAVVAFLFVTGWGLHFKTTIALFGLLIFSILFVPYAVFAVLVRRRYELFWNHDRKLKGNALGDVPAAINMGAFMHRDREQ